MLEPVTSTTDHSQDRRRVSLLDLPQHVFDDIIVAVRQSINFHGYLCDLRLVSKKFNVAVLHCLAFRLDASPFHPAHFMSCKKTDCYLDACTDVGAHNTAYARIFLKGKISLMSDRAQDPRLSKHYTALSRALETFRAGIKRSVIYLDVTKVWLSDGSFYSSNSLNTIITDAESLIFCDSVVTFYKMNWRHPFYRNWLQSPWLDSDLQRCNYKFWLTKLACYLGDIQLFQRYSSHQNLAFGYLHSVAALRGHENFWKMLIAHEPLSCYDHSAVCAAILGGNIPILNTILDAAPHDMLPMLCAKGLAGLSYFRRWPHISVTAIEQVLKRYNMANERNVRLAMIALVNLGAIDALRMVVHHFNSWLWIVPPLDQGPFILPGEEQYSAQSPLWWACVNGDLECARVLIEGNRCTKLTDRDIFEFYGECLMAATHANSLAICQELLDREGRNIEDMSIINLAAIDGSLDIMTKKLAIDPGILDTISRVDSVDHTVGEAALRYAAWRLRADNVRFLLERGVRAINNSYWTHFKVGWRYRRAHEKAYQDVQKLFRDHGMKELDLIL